MLTKNLRNQLIFFICFFLFLVMIAGQVRSIGVDDHNINLKKITPNIIVEDMDKTLSFYREILGFDVIMTSPKAGPFDWALLRFKHEEIMFEAKSNFIKKYPSVDKDGLGGAFTLYIDMENISGFYENVKNRVKILKEMHNTFYGTREFAMEDCNGFVLVFAEGRERD